MTKASFQAFCRNYTGTALEAMADAHALCDLQNAASGDIAARLGAISGLPPAVAVQVAWNGTDTDLDTYFNAGVAILRSLGTNAHVWLPGANGVSVASLPSNNYLLSDGSTGYSTVDGVDGLTLDGMSSSTTKGAILSGAVGTYLTTPDSAASSITGDIDIRVKASCTDWTPTVNMSFTSKIQPAGQNAWQFVISFTGTLGKLTLWNSTDGTNLTTNESSVGTGFTDGTTHWVRVTRVATTGIIKYYTSEDGSTWTQLGTDIAGSTGNFIDSTSIVEIGSSRGGTINNFTGKIYQVQIYNGIAGTLAVEFKATDYSTGTTLTSSTTGEVWTLNGAAYIVPDGTHLTQATTANKPLVRRGAYNLLPYSERFNTSWTASNMTVAASDSLIPTATNAAHAVIATSIAKTAVALKYVVSGRCKANGYNFLLLRIDAGSGDGVYVGFNVSTGAISTAAATSGAGWVAGTAVIATPSSDGYCNFSIPFTTGTEAIIRVIPYVSNATGAAFSPSSFSGDTTSGVNLKIQLERGVVTAGDYTPTTTTAASNPSAGKYWWSFDGSNDSLLSGNLGITNACTIVIAGRVNSLAAINYLLGEDTNGVQLYINTNGSLSFGKVTIADILVSSAGQIVAGVPFVLTVRLSGGTAVFRLNGAQIATGATAYTFSATTGARIGMTFASILPLNGAIGWVVPIAAALSDADCLTVERLVGQRFPGMATF